MSLVLIAGDVACFLLFAILGLRSHEEGLTAASLFRVAAPYAGAWVAVAYAYGLFRLESQAFQAGKLAAAWPVAWLLGSVARSLVFDRPLLTMFPVITFVVAGALLLGWRTLALRLLRRREGTPLSSSGR